MDSHDAWTWMDEDKWKPGMICDRILIIHDIKYESADCAKLIN